MQPTSEGSAPGPPSGCRQQRARCRAQERALQQIKANKDEIFLKMSYGNKKHEEKGS
jgi:hypothetical protein